MGLMWDLLPTTATQELVVELAHLLRTRGDVAMALRSEQLRHRGRWQRTGEPRPYEWAEWSVISTGTWTG